MSPSTTDGRAPAAAGPPAGGSLAREMAATLALVAAVDAVAVAVVAFLVAPWVEPFVPPGTPSVLVGGVAVVAATGAFLLGHLRYARRGVLAAVGADVVSASTHPELHARVTRLAAQFDLKPPELAVVDADAPNSLAVGGPRASTVVVSRGLRERLSEGELDAVVAHELAHVKNRDATVMTLATALPAVANGEYAVDVPSGAAGYVGGGVALCCLYVAATPRLPGPALSAASLGAFGLAVVATLLLGGALLGLLAAPVVALTRRLSRRRELVADAAGARATGDPAAMANAIRTLSETGRTDRDLRSASPSLDGLCFLPHGFETAADGGSTSNESKPGTGVIAARTHPSVEERMANLRAVTASMERSASSS